MSIWCEDNGKTCTVCLAGATIALRYGGNSPDVFAYGLVTNSENGHKFRALDSLQRGHVGCAATYMRIEFPQAYKLSRDVPPYHTNRAAWWKAMRKLLTDLKKADI